MNFSNEKINDILNSIESIVESTELTKSQKLMSVCRTLDNEVEHYDWTGFYLVDREPGVLILGPYVGDSTDHTRIEFGKGICGQAADAKETFVIQDVSTQDNYLSCSVHVNSEIVVPIMRKNVVIGEIDIDSHKKSPFDNSDKELLEKAAILIEKLL